MQLATLNAEVLAMDTESGVVRQAESDAQGLELQLSALKKASAHLALLMKISPEVRERKIFYRYVVRLTLVMVQWLLPCSTCCVRNACVT